MSKDAIKSRPPSQNVAGKEALEGCRLKIDALDARIVELLNERTLIVEEIGSIKHSLNLPIYEPRREDQVYRNVTGSNRGPMPGESLRRIFERIIDEMRTIQRMRMEERSADAAGDSEGVSQQ